MSDEEGDPLVIPDDQVHIGDKKLISKKAIATVEKGWSGMRSRLVELAKLFWPEGDHVNWSLKKGLRRNVVSTQHVESMIKILDTMRWSKTPNLSLKYVKRELGKALSAGDAGGAGDEEAGSNEENKPNTKTQNEDKDRDLKKKDDKKANDNIFSEECVGLHSKTTELLQSVTEILALKNNDHGNTAGIDGLNEIDGEHVEDEEDDSEEDDSEEDEDEDDEEGDSEDSSDNDDGEERGDDKKVGADTDN
ncbi:hypothetical protein FOCC_FOCC002846 [Frankliniella occidentalis]|nr:hypothetical protein FOCC_FOCC002846 [Frankliniella occidentalis]